MFLYPYQSIRLFCHFSHFDQPGDFERIALPFELFHLEPKRAAQRSGTFS